MPSTWLTRAGRSAVAVFVVAATVGASVAVAKPAPDRAARRRGLNLFALTFGVMNVNNQFCGINNIGELCVDPTNSPVVGGGFWPKGTPDQYIFNSGLQLAGTIPANAGFAWAGDTIGAFFMDPRGDQAEGDPITLVYNSLDPSDATAANWPHGAYVRDTTIYDPILVARADSGRIKQDGSGIAVSQQDLWVRTWDGNPALLAGRTHPMGVLVEEHGLAWNFPTGNEDIIYFVFSFTNVTAGNPAVYDASPSLAYLPQDVRDEIKAVGADFQSRNNARFNITLPVNGYSFTNLFAAFFADMDVGDASVNYSTSVTPFSMGVAYKADFLEPNWVFPPSIFGAPFAPSPGFIGVKYLKSPLDSAGNPIGLTIWSNTLNSATGFPDPVGVKQLYRYLSGTASPAAGDNPCNTQGGTPLQRHYCYAAQNFADTRFYQSSGPFTLAPGEQKSIVVAYINAAPLAIVAAAPGFGTDVKPDYPETGQDIVNDPNTVREIERIMGWESQTDANGDGAISQDEVKSVPRSLLDKAIVAQNVYNNRFLLPFAPEPPKFFLVPGDNQVTITWQKSGSEDPVTGGDPYFAVASAPLVACTPPAVGQCANPLYDPNFKKFDVEGYRIYRGRNTGDLSLVAQFDYSGTVLTDYTGAFAYTSDLDGDGHVACAPELGVQNDCGTPDIGQVVFDTAPPYTTSIDHDIVGNVVQVPAGGRVLLASGDVLILKADTAVSGGGSGNPKLTNSGVGFAFIDRSVRNDFTYFYTVTAFDVNSLRSGPSSLESPKITKQATPRHAPNATQAVLVQQVLGSDGTVLNPNAPYPTIDAATGNFSGLMPPANDGALSLIAGSELLPSGNISLRIDSVSAGEALDPTLPILYLSITAGGQTVQQGITLPENDVTSNAAASWDFGQAGTALVPIDSTRARAFGVKFTQDTRLPISFGGITYPISRSSPGVATAVGRFGTTRVGGVATQYLGHSRWFTGNTENVPDPTITALADSAHNSGALPGVSSIWAPSAYRDADSNGVALQINFRFRNYAYAQLNWYMADFLVTWNADSSLTVFDSTHHSILPYAPNGGSGWGFVNVAAFTAAGLTAGNLRQGGDPVPTNLANVTYNHIYGVPDVCVQRGLPCITLGNKAQYEALDMNHDGTADANGIALDINGEVFLMAMPSIPAAGTHWRLRTVAGSIGATCTPALQPVMTDCSGYTFSGPSVRPSLAPGLTYQVAVSKQYNIDSTTTGDLSLVHTVPDPYYVTNALEATANTKILKFVNLPPKAIIRIYSLSGVLVNVVYHHDPNGGGEATWNLRNRNNQFVASGVYFYHVEAPDGKTKVGKFTVVNFAP